MKRLVVEQMILSKGKPCYILAPDCCGQQALLSAFMSQAHVSEIAGFYRVNELGHCTETLGSFAGAPVPPPHAQRQDAFCAQLTGAPLGVAVVEQVPWLDDEGASRLSQELSALLQRYEYVFVCCEAQNDRFESLASNRVTITAAELKAGGFFTRDEFTACLVHFLDAFLPVHIRLLAALAAVFGEVEFKELSALGYHFPKDLALLLPSLNPLFSANAEGTTIYSEPICLRQLDAALFTLLKEYLENSGEVASISKTVAKMTELSMALLEKGQLEASHNMLALAEECIKRGGIQTAVSELESSSPLAGTNAEPHKAPWSIKQHYSTPFQSKAAHTPDKLYVKIFGDLEVFNNGEVVRNPSLDRTKVRRMLAYLALNQNKAVPRDNLVEYLWPYFDEDRAVKNLYTTWSFLGKALGLDTVRGSRFLLRNGEHYQLNPQLIICDVHQFGILARNVLFGRQELDEQIDCLLTMEALYQDSLATCLAADSFINTKMESYRALMVDALLLVARQLRSAGEAEKALFCARAASELDESREDVYRDLMDTQLLAGQRTSAMQTYFSCKRYLSDELGILPSKSTTQLYQNLLLDNCT